MIRICKDKIVRAAVGSARLEGYQGHLKAPTIKKVAPARPEAKSETTAERQPPSTADRCDTT